MAVLKTVIPVLLALLVTACATGKREFIAAEPAPEKGSVLYLYRPHNTANALLLPEISVDGMNSMRLSNGEYRWLYLKPGEYAIRLEAVEGYTPATQLMLTVVPSSVNYLRLGATIGMTTGVRYSAFSRGFSLQQVPAELARDEIAKCSDAEAIAEKHRKTDMNDEMSSQSEAVFSTDKTANPFSR